VLNHVRSTLPHVLADALENSEEGERDQNEKTEAEFDGPYGAHFREVTRTDQGLYGGTGERSALVPVCRHPDHDKWYQVERAGCRIGGDSTGCTLPISLEVGDDAPYLAADDLLLVKEVGFVLADCYARSGGIVVL